MRSLTLATLLLFALTSFGVSRIGGGKVSSNSSQFEMKVASAFFDLQQVESMIVANGPLEVQSNQVIQQFLQIREFSDFYSHLTLFTRQETEAYFTSRGWQKEPSQLETCIDIYSYKNNSTAGFVATWGSGKGVSVVGPLTGMVISGLEETWGTLALQPGACAWN